MRSRNRLNACFGPLLFSLLFVAGCASSGNGGTKINTNLDRLNPDAATSTVSVSPSSGLVADGQSTSTITVTVLNNASEALAGKAIHLNVSGNQNTLSATDLSSGDDGKATATLASTEAGDKTVTATVGEGSSAVTLSQTPTVTFTPVTPPFLTSVMKIVTGAFHTCALVSGGQIYCWGQNEKGQLGNGTQNRSAYPAPVVDISNAVDLVAGWWHTCAILSTGDVKCWGSNLYGELQFNPAVNPRPVVMGNIGGTVKALSAGNSTTCALRTDGKIMCWGDGGWGQLGNNQLYDNSTRTGAPQEVFGISTATAVSSNNASSCALLLDRTVKCWGDNGWGQVGKNPGHPDYMPSTSTPQQVMDMGIPLTAIWVSMGGDHACAVVGPIGATSGPIKCWGANDNGQFGNGVTFPFADPSPDQAQNITTAQSVAAAGWRTCALLTDRSVWCWGNGHLGQLGNGTEFANSTVPVMVSNLDYSVMSPSGLAVQESHSCVIFGDNRARCWGLDNDGQLGDGRTAEPEQTLYATTPVDVLHP
ncbi:MAG: invasin domain 3-containing protein [Pseudomonadota bacterium]